MKRKLFLAVCFCGLLALPGCGRQEAVEDQTEKVTEQTAETEVSAEEETPSRGSFIRKYHTGDWR